MEKNGKKNGKITPQNTIITPKKITPKSYQKITPQFYLSKTMIKPA